MNVKNRDKNYAAGQAVRELIVNLRGLVRMGGEDDGDNRLCGEATAKANRAIDMIGDLAELFIEGYIGNAVQRVERVEPASPTNPQWAQARIKVANRVNTLRNDINERILNGKIHNMPTDVLRLVDDHRRWVERLTITEATR